jgi:hypothetical protein
MTISYRDAMASLRAMFADIDPDVIHAVLESNEGRMDPTINDLLQMQSADPVAPAQPSPAQPNLPRPVHIMDIAPAQPVKVQSDLPDDFLRPPSYFKRKGGARNDEDERIARMLQEEFNRRERDQLYYGQDIIHPNPRSQAGNRAGISREPSEERPANRDESIMGSAKKKFELLKEKFRKHRARGASHNELLDEGEGEDDDQALIANEPRGQHMPDSSKSPVRVQKLNDDVLSATQKDRIASEMVRQDPVQASSGSRNAGNRTVIDNRAAVRPDGNQLQLKPAKAASAPSQAKTKAEEERRKKKEEEDANALSIFDIF